MNNYNHLHEKFRHVAALSDNDRIAFIDSPRWIGYEKANDVLGIMQGLMNKLPQHRMPNLLIIGESNSGKTTILHEFKRRFGEPYVDDGAVVPVCLIQAPPSAHEKELYLCILNAYVLPFRYSDSAAKLRFQVLHTLRELHTKILIIDEAHSMLSGTARQQRQIMLCIKYLCNELRIPIVLAGTKDAIRILHTDSQHASRFDVAEIPVWQNDKSFKRLLSSFEKILPLKQPSKLTHPEKIGLIHSISGGNLGNVKRLINECAVDAIKSGEERITTQMIKDKSWLKPTKSLRKIIG